MNRVDGGGERARPGAKRILFLVSSMQGGGAERVAALLCNHWAAAGHEVTLMPTFSRGGTCIYPLDRRVRLDYLAERVRGRRGAPANPLRRFLALRRAVRESRADAVVSFLSKVNVAALVAVRGLAVPVIVSERIHPPAMPLGVLWGALRRITYPWARAVVVQTETTAQWLRTACPQANVSVIANPVVFPLPAGEPRRDPAEWLGRDRRVVIAAGRLDRQKGFDLLLEAFSGLAGRHPGWDLVILGEGGQREDLERRRRTLGLNGRVHLPGRVGNPGDWYLRSDLFAMSSRFEGFPNSLTEAMAHGLPVVSFDCDAGPRDIIRAGVDGLLVPPERGVGGLEEALATFMNDAPLRAKAGEAAREARKRFDPTTVGALWDAALGFVD